MNKKRRQKGSALIIVLLVILLLSLLGLPLLELTLTSHKGIVASTNQTKARYLAEMGAKEGYNAIVQRMNEFNQNPSWSAVDDFITELEQIQQPAVSVDPKIPDEKIEYYLENIQYPLPIPREGLSDSQSVQNAGKFYITGNIIGIGEANHQKMKVSIPFTLTTIFSDFQYALFAYSSNGQNGNITVNGNVLVDKGNVHADKSIQRNGRLTVASAYRIEENQSIPFSYTPEQMDHLMAIKKDQAQNKRIRGSNSTLVLGLNLGSLLNYVGDLLEYIYNILQTIGSSLHLTLPSLPLNLSPEGTIPNGEWYVNGNLILIGNGNVQSTHSQINSTFYVTGNVYIIPLLSGNPNDSFNLNATIISQGSVYFIGIPPVSHFTMNLNSFIWAKQKVEVDLFNLLGYVTLILNDLLDILSKTLGSIINGLLDLVNKILNSLLGWLFGSLDSLLDDLFNLLKGVFNDLSNFTFHLNGGVIANNITLNAYGGSGSSPNTITFTYDPYYKQKFSAVQPLEGFTIDTSGSWSISPVQ